MRFPFEPASRASLVRDKFLVDGESRSISWDFLQDLLTEMLPDISAEAKGFPVVSLEQMDLNNRYPTAGSMFKVVSERKKPSQSSLTSQMFGSKPDTRILTAHKCNL